MDDGDRARDRRAAVVATRGSITRAARSTRSSTATATWCSRSARFRMTMSGTTTRGDVPGGCCCDVRYGAVAAGCTAATATTTCSRCSRRSSTATTRSPTRGSNLTGNTCTATGTDPEIWNADGQHAARRLAARREALLAGPAGDDADDLAAPTPGSARSRRSDRLRSRSAPIRRPATSTADGCNAAPTAPAELLLPRAVPAVHRDPADRR